MIKTLMGSIRDYMKVTVATPLLVLGEVLCEMLIPFITANLIDAIKDGATVAEMLPTAGFLVLIALTSLAFGAAAGVTCSHASCGFAKNLRHDLFYKIQTFSFANIDEFSSSSLVTRLTTDINNVQQAFMMIIAGLDLRLYHGIYHGRQRRHGLPGHHSAAGLWTVLYHL
jgi:ATP-binding cassette subfamily B multidrug efflux pump